MTQESWAPVATAVIAGAVALIGYLLSQHAARRERKSKIYAEALATVRSLEEMPFRIRRRPSSDPETRAALATRLSDVFTDLRFHIVYLQVDSKVVGDSFIDLVDRTREFGAKFRTDAWESPVMIADADMNMRFGYEYEISLNWIFASWPCVGNYPFGGLRCTGEPARPCTRSDGHGESRIEPLRQQG